MKKKSLFNEKKEKETYDMECQLQVLSSAGLELLLHTKLILLLRKKLRYLVSTSKRIISNPRLILNKINSFMKLHLSHSDDFASKSNASVRPHKLPLVLKLAPSEQVRVKSFEEIASTLDERGRCEGLSYIPSVMNKYCGGIYTVKKRIKIFFDERNWKLIKIRNVVILDDVCCESHPSSGEDWAGCDRTCFLFWKEAWLERIRSD